jgi:serine phosphatase RsbU (regulator of sigma subunit)
MSEDPEGDEREHRHLRREIVDQEREIRESDDRERRQDALIKRLREEAAVREEDVAVLRERLEAAEHELEDLRAIRNALTPSELPQRPGLDLAAAFLPAEAATSTWRLRGRGIPPCWSSAM